MPFQLEPPRPALLLPFGLLRVPPYRAGAVGRWKLMRGRPPTVAQAYFSGVAPGHKVNWVLRRNGKVWMSITPMRLESQAHHAAAANGHTVIMGLGLGVLLYNVLAKQNVSKVTLVEWDGALVSLLETVASFRTWPGAEKLQIEISDALQWRARQPVDVLLADIWHTLGEKTLRPNALTICKNVPASLYGFWGMELDFVTWLGDNGISPNEVTDAHFQRYAAFLDMPLIGQRHQGFARLALRAAAMYATQ